MAHTITRSTIDWRLVGVTLGGRREPDVSHSSLAGLNLRTHPEFTPR